MGGKCIIIDHIVDRRTGFPLTIVTNMGRILKRELIQREVRVGAMYIDFGIANRYYKRGIEIDGRDFHRDITVEQERDEYLAKYGWSVLHIQAADIYRQPMLVQRKVLNFLARWKFKKLCAQNLYPGFDAYAYIYGSLNTNFGVHKPL